MHFRGAHNEKVDKVCSFFLIYIYKKKKTLSIKCMSKICLLYCQNFILVLFSIYNPALYKCLAILSEVVNCKIPLCIFFFILENRNGDLNSDQG